MVGFGTWLFGARSENTGAAPHRSVQGGGKGQPGEDGSASLGVAACLRSRAQVAVDNHERLSEVRKIVGEDCDSRSLHGGLALEYGLRAGAMQKEWADWAADRLSS